MREEGLAGKFERLKESGTIDLLGPPSAALAKRLRSLLHITAEEAGLNAEATHEWRHPHSTLPRCLANCALLFITSRFFETLGLCTATAG